MANPNPSPNQGDAPPQYTGHPFFDFLQSMQGGPGAGVDHREGPFADLQWADFAGPSFDGCPRGRGGRCHRGGGRRWRGFNNPNMSTDENAQFEQGAAEAQGQANEKEDSPDTMRDVDDPPEEYPQGPGARTHHHRRGPPPFSFWGGPFGPRGPHSTHGRHGRHGPHGPHGPGFHHPPGPPPPFPFDASTIQSFIQPFAQAARNWGEQMQRAAANATAGTNSRDGADVDTFEPPVDVFNTDRAFVLHVALPGAKKEDVGVNWDGDKGELSIAGVVHRPGDEDFLQTLVSSERKAGVFERTIKLPPQGMEKEEVDGLAISAKMEDGVLIVVVPKLEKEWTEVRKVDIE